MVNAKGRTDQTSGPVTTEGVEVVDSKSNGVGIIFDQPRQIRINRKGMAYRKKSVCGRIEIDLPVPVVGRTVKFSYSFVPKK